MVIQLFRKCALLGSKEWWNISMRWERQSRNTFGDINNTLAAICNIPVNEYLNTCTREFWKCQNNKINYVIISIKMILKKRCSNKVFHEMLLGKDKKISHQHSSINVSSYSKIIWLESNIGVGHFSAATHSTLIIWKDIQF